MPKILVVDDDPLLRTMLRDGLEQAGYTVLEAQSGQEALEITKAERPNCILLDIMMPGMDGYDTCKAIKAVPGLGSIPVLLISATTDLRVVDQAEQVGAAGVLPKPVPIEQLQHTVALALASPPGL
jgi:CheY-like chemotaxis protein